MPTYGRGPRGRATYSRTRRKTVSSNGARAGSLGMVSSPAGLSMTRISASSYRIDSRLLLRARRVTCALEVLVVPAEDPLLEIDRLAHAVRRPMTAVGVAHPFDFASEPPQGVIDLARLARRHIRILFTGEVQQGRLDAIGAHDGRVIEIALGVFPERPADPVLALFRRVRVAHTKPRTVGVEAHHVDFARDVDRGFESVGFGEQQHRRIAAVTRAVHAK